MKKEYVDKLAEVLKRHQPRETILVTGSRSEGRRILSLLAARGHLLVGVRAETPFSLAQELCAGAPHLMGEVEGADFVRSCMAQKTGVYSGVNAKTLTATRSMFRTFQEMALAGLPEDLAGIPELQELPKLQELLTIRSAYLQKKAGNLIDRADLLRMAIEAAAPEQHAPLHRAYYVVLGDYAPAPLERQLLDRLAGEDRLTVVALPCAKGVDLPVGAMAQDLPRVDAVEAVRKASPRLAACRGMETEVDFVFRDLLGQKELRLEDCAVVYLSDRYAQPLYEEAARFGIPVSMGGGLSMTGSLLYTTLKQVEELRHMDFYAENVCKLLESFSLTPKWPVQLAEQLRQKRVGWGKARYQRVCDPADADQSRPKNMAEEEWKPVLGDWSRFLKLLVAVAEPEDGLEQQRQDLLAFLPYCSRKSMTEAAANVRAAELLEQVMELDQEETLLRRLLALMETSTYLGGSAEPGKLYCAPLSQSAFTGRRRLYVLGLSRYAVQGTRKESPILLDSERKALRVLKTSAQLGQEQEFRLLTLLARYDGELILTYPDFDSDKMLDQKPAPFFEEVSEGCQVEKISYIPQDCRTALDCIISERKLQPMPPAKPWILQEGETIVLQEKKSVEALLQEMKLSATALEDALRCPCLFYFKYLMKLRRPQPVERNTQTWLDFKETGTFCHTVLEKVYTEGQTAGWEEIFEAEFEDLKQNHPLPHPDLEQETKLSLKGFVQRAVEWTAKSGRTVKATELKFNNLPMTFDNWTLNMTGSIDRVDDLGNGEYAILDYKTGRPENYKDELHRHWQHYLYTRAAEQLENTTVREAGYLFLKGSAELETLTEDDDRRNETKAWIVWLLDRISSEAYTMECLPCYEPQSVSSDVQPPKPRLLEPTDNREALKTCKDTCEFAAICPAQQPAKRKKKGGR